MTTLENRPNSALLVVDVQVGVVDGAYERDVVVANIASLVRKARRDGAPVVWVRDSGSVPGSDDWQIVPELGADDAEPHIDKDYGDAFEATSLESVLSGLGVGRLFVVGANTDACVRSTIHGAFVRGYDTTPRQRRAHDRRQDSGGRAAPGPGHRPHEHVLDPPEGAGPDSRNGGHRRRRLRRRLAARPPAIRRSAAIALGIWRKDAGSSGRQARKPATSQADTIRSRAPHGRP